MEGFFSREEEQKMGIGKGSRIPTCEDCGLYRNCNSPKMELSGKGKKKILVIAEAPGKMEDEEGTQLIGKTGQLFRKVLRELGYDLDRDFWKMNAVNCRPPKNRDPRTLELNACRPRIEKAIADCQPKSIITLGKYGWEGLMGERLSGRISGIWISGWVGEQIPDQELLCWICPTYHPAYIARSDRDRALMDMWKEHLRKGIKWAEKRIIIQDWESKIKYTEQREKAFEWLKEIKGWGTVAFDFETTGIKPHRPGQRIHTVSFSNGEMAYAFPNFPDGKFQFELRGFLNDKNIKKIVQNFKFEDQWSQVKLREPIQGWDWDTMLGAHCIHNQKPTGLKFQVYVKYGILGYDSTIDKYITGCKVGEDPKSGNSFNLIKDAPMDEVLKYNAADSLFAYWLAEGQKKALKDEFREGALFLLEGSRTLSNIQTVGIRLDEEKLEMTTDRLDKRLKRLHEKVMSSEEIKKWDGSKKINFNSDKQLKHLLYSILKLKPTKGTDKGNVSVDKEVLEKINIPFTQSILEYRRWLKAKDTYLAQYSREIMDGKVYTSFNLHTVKTFRSSSNGPNMQNNPNRDERVKKMVRSIFIPRKGNRLVEWDYKGIEVSVAACVTGDKNLIKYVTDLTTDMHRDIAADLLLKMPEKITKEERYITKNGFVFPEFYGDYFKQIAPNIWDRISDETKRHLSDKGIRIFRDFSAHVEGIEKIFWEERFPEFAGWRKKVWRDYQKKGYIDTVTGFRCRAPMTRNKVANYPIQGPAFHCLLWSLNKIEPRIRKRFDGSYIIGQIHDAIVGDVRPEDETELDHLVWEYGTQKIREHWDWIVVPLAIEKERSEMDGSWAVMFEQGYLKGE